MISFGLVSYRNENLLCLWAAVFDCLFVILVDEPRILRFGLIMIISQALMAFPIPQLWFSGLLAFPLCLFEVSHIRKRAYQALVELTETPIKRFKNSNTTFTKLH
jgi:hypothetical protein